MIYSLRFEQALQNQMPLLFRFGHLFNRSHKPVLVDGMLVIMRLCLDCWIHSLTCNPASQFERALGLA